MSENVPAYLSEVQSLRLLFLFEAIESAKQFADTPAARRDHVISYLKSTERSWRLSCNYERAYQARELCKIVERSTTVRQARAIVLGHECEGPVSNTGPPDTLVQDTMLDYLGGSNGRNS